MAVLPRSGKARAGAAVAAGLLVAALACASGPPALTAGVSRALAQHRARTLANVRYDLHLVVPAEREAPVRGVTAVRAVVRDPSVPLILDFAAPPSRVLALRVGGRPVTPDLRAGHVGVPAAALVPGENRVEIEFLAGDLSLNRNPDFLYTLLVPDRASTAFPCFDQPDLKARFTLALDLPAAWVAVANGAPGSVERSGDRVVYRFAETEPISTYLFAFAAGAFQVDSAERGGRRFRMFHRETDAAKVERNRAAIFDLHHQALRWLEAYTGIPYPFGKFDFVLVPAFQYGGMEHPGAIFYRADGLLLDQSATQNQILGRASVIAHETAHMWFGDLVTMRWFNDVWLKEVFANFMAAKIVNPSFPEIDHDLRFFLAHYPAAYAVDRTEGATPIRQPLDNLREAGTLYGPVIYDKAPIVMRHLELLVGRETFRDGLREYLDRFRFGNATWDDLVAILDRRSREDVTAWSRTWVDEPGRPAVRARWARAGERLASLALEQADPTNRGRVWNQQLGVMLLLPDSVRRLTVRLARRAATVERARGLPLPQAVFPGADGVAYGRFDLDSTSLARLIAALPDLPDPLARGVGWVTLWDALLEGSVPPAAVLGRLLEAFPNELDELTTQRMLGYLADAYWRFLSDAARRSWAPRIEEALWAGVQRAEPRTLKAAYYRTFVTTALTEPAVARLRRLWMGRDSVAGLPLSENDLTRLALELAVRGTADWERMLDTQRTRIRNPDRRAQFDFVRPSLSPVEAVRDSVFASFRAPKNREHEPWVLEALSYLHHPLRARQAERYILPSLELLAEIQSTGDIFFPARWLDATLGGHNTPAAASIVRGFLDRERDYPARLRAKILQSADPLFRAASIVEHDRAQATVR
ncbi:MAG: ERAP1-like C-terminal domain-containing protein [Gemmatimonadetes bacterium]|nr:ERAP1-like C-terminal domain-containing protein [Gemmatimonadota bacterium]